MGRQLVYGQRVIDHLAGRPRAERDIVIIRHSERPSLIPHPVEIWDDILLTPRGIHAANEFGRALVEEVGIDRMRVYSWGSRRCAQTADAIASGVAEAGCEVSPREAMNLGSPVVNRERYDDIMRLHIWDEFLKDWLDPKKGHEAMAPFSQFARGVFQKVLSDGVCRPGEVTLIATHDLYVIPLATRAFSSPVTKVDFLDGLVIGADSKRVHLGFGGASTTLERETFLS